MQTRKRKHDSSSDVDEAQPETKKARIEFKEFMVSPINIRDAWIPKAIDAVRAKDSKLLEVVFAQEAKSPSTIYDIVTPVINQGLWEEYQFLAGYIYRLMPITTSTNLFFKAFFLKNLTIDGTEKIFNKILSLVPNCKSYKDIVSPLTKDDFMKCRYIKVFEKILWLIEHNLFSLSLDDFLSFLFNVQPPIDPLQKTMSPYEVALLFDKISALTNLSILQQKEFYKKALDFLPRDYVQEIFINKTNLIEVTPLVAAQLCQFNMYKELAEKQQKETPGYEKKYEGNPLVELSNQHHLYPCKDKRCVRWYMNVNEFKQGSQIIQYVVHHQPDFLIRLKQSGDDLLRLHLFMLAKYERDISKPSKTAKVKGKIIADSLEALISIQTVLLKHTCNINLSSCNPDVVKQFKSKLDYFLSDVGTTSNFFDKKLGLKFIENLLICIPRDIAVLGIIIKNLYLLIPERDLKKMIENLGNSSFANFLSHFILNESTSVKLPAALHHLSKIDFLPQNEQKYIPTIMHYTLYMNINRPLVLIRLNQFYKGKESKDAVDASLTNITTKQIVKVIPKRCPLDTEKPSQITLIHSLILGLYFLNIRDEKRLEETCVLLKRFIKQGINVSAEIGFQHDGISYSGNIYTFMAVQRKLGNPIFQRLLEILHNQMGYNELMYHADETANILLLSLKRDRQEAQRSIHGNPTVQLHDDKQNTHKINVHYNASLVAVKLREHYFKNKKINQNSFYNEIIGEIKSASAKASSDKSHIFTDALSSLEYRFKDEEQKTFCDPVSKVSLPHIIMLAWTALKDEKLRDCSNKEADLNLFISTLYHIEHDHGDEHDPAAPKNPMCAGGAFNDFTQMLVHQHPLFEPTPFTRDMLKTFVCEFYDKQFDAFSDKEKREFLYRIIYDKGQISEQLEADINRAKEDEIIRVVGEFQSSFSQQKEDKDINAIANHCDRFKTSLISRISILDEKILNEEIQKLRDALLNISKNLNINKLFVGVQKAMQFSIMDSYRELPKDFVMRHRDGFTTFILEEQKKLGQNAIAKKDIDQFFDIEDLFPTTSFFDSLRKMGNQYYKELQHSFDHKPKAEEKPAQFNKQESKLEEKKSTPLKENSFFSGYSNDNEGLALGLGGLSSQGAGAGSRSGGLLAEAHAAERAQPVQSAGAMDLTDDNPTSPALRKS